MDRATFQKIHFPSQQFLEPYLQAGLIKQTELLVGLRSNIERNIDIRLLACLPAGLRAEQVDRTEPSGT